MKDFRLFKYLEGDRTVWMIAIILGLFSILAVYSSISSLAYKYQDGNTFHFFAKHGFMVVIGFAIMYGMHRVPHRWMYRLSQLLIWVTGGLLLVTLLFGSSINSASRWLTIPFINQTFQTSDLAKLVLIAFVARMISRRHSDLKSLQKGVLPVMWPILGVVLLILPANFSTAFLLLSVCMIILFVAGARFVHLLGIAGAGIALFIGLLAMTTVFPDMLPRATTWKNRIVSFSQESPTQAADELDLHRNYQAEMAKIAIHRGGLLPNGPGKGTSRNYLPHPYSDMIYAFIIEEYGSVFGGFGLLLLYIILLFRVIKIASQCRKRFSAYLALGLGFLMVLQALSNMAVAVNLIPVTGQPLPLVSMGGTSLWFTCISLGIILSISRENQLAEGSPEQSEVSYA